MNTIDTNPGTWYCFFCTAPATVTAEIDGEYVTLAVLDSEGKESFCAPAESISIETDGKFRVLPTKASAGTSGGGYFHSNLNVGHGVSAAVAAQCTLTLGDLATGGTLADSNGQSVELEAPHTYAEGGAVFRDVTEAGTLTIGEWSKAWEEKKDAKASGVFSIMGDEDTISVTNGEDEYSVQVPANYDTSVDDWTAAFAAAGCGVVCTAVEAHGETEVSVEAAEAGEAGNGFVISVENYEPVTLAGGSSARTAVDVFNDIHEDPDCPVDVTLDADEMGLGFTAKEYGVNDAISAEGDMFSNWTGMSGGHGDYTVAELVTAISGEFDDIAPTAGEAGGTITLTAITAGADANSITYTATGCFGGGTVKQGSTTRGKNAVEQTAFKIYLNGAELDVEPAPLPTALTPTTAMKHGGVYTVESSGSALVFSAVTIEDYNAARVWVDYNGAGGITWPSWSWRTEDGAPPEFDFFHRYKITVENDGLLTRAAVDDSYATRPEYEHTVLTETNMTDTSLELYIVPDETVHAAGAYIPGSVDNYGAFSADKYAGFHPATSLKDMDVEDIQNPLLPGEYADYGKGHSYDRPRLTFCTSRPVSVHAVTLKAASGESGSCVVLQAEVDGEWVLLGGKTGLDTDLEDIVITPCAPVSASKFMVQFGQNGWASAKLGNIRIFEV